MRHSFTVAIAASLLLASPARAQAPRPLTLDDALALARERNRDLGAARARLEQSATGITNAWVALLPQLAVQGKYTHNYKEVTLDLSQQEAPLLGLAEVIKQTSGNPVQNGALNAYEQAIQQATGGPPIVIQKAEQLDFVASLSLPLVVPWAYGALDAAKKTYGSAEANFRVTEATLLLQTAQAFFTAAGADAILTARLHAIEVAKQTVDNARARLEVGVVNRVEVTRAQLALLRAEQSAKEAADGVVQAYRALATILVEREPFRVVSPPDPPPVAESADQLAADALQLRPEFAALQKTVAAADSTVSSSLWRWAPTLSGFGNVRAFNYAGFNGDKYSWAVGLQLDWILYDGGARDVQRKLAEAQKRENELRLGQLRDTVTDDVQVARRALETKRQALETALRSVELSKETLDLVRVQHDAGTATQLDLLQAQDALVSAEVAVAQARYDLALSDLSLKRTAGLFPK